jgi:hypothetical protein
VQSSDGVTHGDSDGDAAAHDDGRAAAGGASDGGGAGGGAAASRVRPSMVVPEFAFAGTWAPSRARAVIVEAKEVGAHNGGGAIHFHPYSARVFVST